MAHAGRRSGSSEAFGSCVATHALWAASQKLVATDWAYSGGVHDVSPTGQSGWGAMRPGNMAQAPPGFAHVPGWPAVPPCCVAMTRHGTLLHVGSTLSFCGRHVLLRAFFRRLM